MKYYGRSFSLSSIAFTIDTNIHKTIRIKTKNIITNNHNDIPQSNTEEI
jgi:hypothetical protein